jgi:dTDP-glucose 4,6-dehydratase
LLALVGRSDSLLRHVADRPGHDRRYALDWSKLAALGWRPEVALDEGLRATVEWYRANESWWRPIKSGSFRDYYHRHYADRLSEASPSA